MTVFNYRKQYFFKVFLIVFMLVSVSAQAAENSLQTDNPQADTGQAVQQGNNDLLMVLPLQANGVNQEVADSLMDLLLQELDTAQLYNVMSQIDLQALLSQVEIKQMMGLESETDLAAIAKKLKADYLLRGSVGLVGKTYLVSLTLIEVKSATVKRRINQMVTGNPDDLIGSLHAAVVALALEEEGVPPKITAELVEGLNISRKNKTLFLKFMAGYEVAVGPIIDENTLAYIRPDLMRLSLSAGYHILPWMQIVFETGAALSIAQDFGMQTELDFIRGYPDSNGGYTESHEFIVNTAHFDYSTMRIPLNVMLRFQPSKGRLLPYVQTGLGASWQRYNLGDESAESIFGSVEITTNPKFTCPYKYKKENGQCVRDDISLSPDPDNTISYFNLQFPIGAGLDYLITHHFGFSLEARYTLTYSLNKNEDDLQIKWKNKPEYYGIPNGQTIGERIGDIHPIQRMSHLVSVMVGVFYYY